MPVFCASFLSPKNTYSLYIALAQGLAKPLISDDKRQCQVAVDMGLAVITIAEFLP